MLILNTIVLGMANDTLSEYVEKAICEAEKICRVKIQPVKNLEFNSKVRNKIC